MEINFTKSRVIGSAQLLAPLQTELTKTSTPVKVLGSVLIPNGSTHAQFVTATKFICDKVMDRCSIIERIQLTLQNKLFLVRLLPIFLRYYIASVHACNVESKKWIAELWKWVDDQHNALLRKLLQLPTNHVLFNVHLKDGGLGVISISDLYEDLHDFGKDITPSWRNLANSLSDKIATFYSWMQVFPSNRHTEIADDEVLRLFLRFRLNDESIKVQTSCSEKTLSHALTCQKCDPQQFWLRHQNVLSAIQTTLKYYHIESTRKTPPLPGNDKGGADLCIFIDGEKDVTITQEKYLNTSFTTKQQKYKQFVQDTGQQVSPFCMSVHASIEQRSIYHLARWANACYNPKEAAFALFANVQCALIKAVGNTLKQLTRHDGSKNDLTQNVLTDLLLFSREPAPSIMEMQNPATITNKECTHDV